MKTLKLSVITMALIQFFSGNSCKPKTSDAPAELLKIENNALKRWASGDVYGFIELFTEDFTYFDNVTKSKLSGREAAEKYLKPAYKTFSIHSFEMVNVDIKMSGDIGILTYNLCEFNSKGDTTSVWNSTEIYQKTGNEWKITHSHWSPTPKETETK